MISYWKTFRNLSSLLRSLTYLSLLNSFLFLGRYSVCLKSLDNYFFRWCAYKSLLSRFSVLISYNMWSSNHFSISSCFPCFSGSGSRVQVLEVASYYSSLKLWILPINRIEVILRSSHWRCSAKIFEYMFFKIANLQSIQLHLCSKSMKNTCERVQL